MLPGRHQSRDFPSGVLALLAREFRQETNRYSGNEVANLFMKHT